MAAGGKAAAKRLGVRYFVPSCRNCPDIKLFQKLIAQHVDVIADGGGYDPTLKPILTKVRKAGILLLASADDIAAKRDLWVSYSGPVAYAHALADALATQTHDKGEYAILDEQGEFPIAHTWANDVAAYIPKAYPNMKSDGLVTESGGGDQVEVDAIKSFMSAHPNLKGLIGITPTEAQCAAQAITQAGRIGQVFVAGNGGGALGWPGSPLPGWIRSGVGQFVYAGDPEKIGYLTIWAARYLLAGHHFRSGAYQAGGPVGLVWYYPKQRDLRVGPPLTITKKNVDFYAKKF
jgi:rhamnose transport system substrate-binding protein